MTPLPNVGIADAVMEVQIDSSVEAVWKAMTSSIGDWWPEGAYSGGASGERSFRLDAKPGGQMIESWAEGAGILWGHVTTVEPLVRLQVSGHTFPNWGGPTIWFGTWELQAKGTGTLLRFSESVICPHPDTSGEDRKKGWHFIYHDALKAHLEGGPAPTWE